MDLIENKDHTGRVTWVEVPEKLVILSRILIQHSEEHPEQVPVADLLFALGQVASLGGTVQWRPEGDKGYNRVPTGDTFAPVHAAPKLGDFAHGASPGSRLREQLPVHVWNTHYLIGLLDALQLPYVQRPTAPDADSDPAEAQAWGKKAGAGVRASMIEAGTSE